MSECFSGALSLELLLDAVGSVANVIIQQAGKIFHPDGAQTGPHPSQLQSTSSDTDRTSDPHGENSSFSKNIQIHKFPDNDNNNTRLRCCPSLTLITHTQITGSVQYPDAVLHVTLPCVFTACLTPRLSLFVLPLSEELKLASQKSQHLEEVLTFTKSLLYKQSPSSRHRSPEVRNSDLINSLWHREDFCPALTEAQTGLASI